MSKKIIGVTVGTTISPAKIESKIKPVKTVNGVEPDESGNVKVAGADVDFAKDEEVSQILEKVYGDNPDNIPEDDLITEDDFATDKEVEDMLNGIFGGN